MPIRPLIILLACQMILAAQDTITPGEVQVQPATLISLGFLWPIEGDGNNNASVEVAYRASGSGEWRDYVGLMRIEKDPIPNAFCGSIMELEPGTDYEVRLTMMDPDGVEGEAVHTVSTATRAQPRTLEGGRILHVYPPSKNRTWQGEKYDKSQNGLMAAINGRSPSADLYPWTDEHVQPGDTILMHAGVYQGDWRNYRDPLGHWQTGSYEIVFDGTPERPITVKPAGDGEVIIDGANSKDGDWPHVLFDVMGADHWIFEDLTIRHADIAFLAGKRGVTGCKGLTVRNCRIENVRNGILALDGRCTDFTITDNVIIGANDGKRIHSQANSASGRSEAGYGVKVIGSGHAIGHNRVELFWDGINVSTNAMPEPEYGLQAYCIDFYNNDIRNICDNFIEADGGLWNIRILHNRCFNSIAKPLSMQPVYVGPVYWLRNIVMNSDGGSFKLISADAMSAWHNTLDGHWTMCFRLNRGDVRNNAFLGPEIVEGRWQGKRPILNAGFDDPENSRLDHNVHRIGKTHPTPWHITRGRDKQQFASLSEMVAATGYERKGLTVANYDGLFEKAEEPARSREQLLDPADYDLRPAPGSPLIDAGTVIPGINDGYAGDAPDIGALEAGRPVPVYGPRG